MQNKPRAKAAKEGVKALLCIFCICCSATLASSLGTEVEKTDLTDTTDRRGAGELSTPTAIPNTNRVAIIEQMYRRATNEFDLADFFKPVETNTEELSFKLAPLFLQESGVYMPTNAFGLLTLSNDVPVLDFSRRAVYVSTDSVEINGKAHARFSYLWFYAVSASGASNRSLSAQGIRLTLNAVGQPAIWEALADPSRIDLILVSEALEAAAAKQFGKPLPGRRYAIEQSLAKAPDAVVARVIDDAPMPMGPIVYLTAATRSVSTVICRCMPAQAKKLALTRTYELLPMEKAPLALFDRETGNIPGHVAFWPGDKSRPNHLEKMLRLPDTF